MGQCIVDYSGESKLGNKEKKSMKMGICKEHAKVIEECQKRGMLKKCLCIKKKLCIREIFTSSVLKKITYLLFFRIRHVQRMVHRHSR